MASFSLKINGKTHRVDAEEDIPLLWVLRDHLSMPGTKYGCGIAMCGACTVLVDGVSSRSCSLKASQLEGKDIITIEGLSDNGGKALQDAWMEVDVPQCGYCQAGQIMNAAGLLKKNASPSDEEIERAMTGNICRCGTYVRIKKAVKLAVDKGGIS